MNTKYTWHESKRQANLENHRLDFAYVFDLLVVLTVVYLPSAEESHIISFRPAKRSEREVDHDWLENDYNDT